MFEKIKKSVKIIGTVGLISASSMVEISPCYADDKSPCSCWDWGTATACCYGWGYCSYRRAACDNLKHPEGYGYWDYAGPTCESRSCSLDEKQRKGSTQPPRPLHLNGSSTLKK